MRAAVPARLDPERAGAADLDAWVACHQRDWARALLASVRLARHWFALGRLGELRAGVDLLAARRAWIPRDRSNAASARRHLTRFYRQVSRAGRIAGEPRKAALLEVGCWRANRADQDEAFLGHDSVVSSEVLLYAYLYGAEPSQVRQAAEFRVQATDLIDQWVRRGCPPVDAVLDQAREAFIACYRELAPLHDTRSLPRSGGQHAAAVEDT